VPAVLDGHVTDPGEEPGQGEVYGHLLIPKEHAYAAYTVDEAIRSLDKLAGKPFSLTCSIDPPHPPFLNVDPYWGMYPAKDMPLPKNFQHDMTYSPYRARQAQMKKYQVAENVREGLSIYYGMVREADDNIGRLLKRLDELGLRENTMVVFTSDHGEMMGSHGMGPR
jgi:arylsulfatase A-like enzyme